MSPLPYFKSLILLSILFFGSAQATEEPANPEDIQGEIVRLYSEGHCDQVKKLSPRVIVKELRPNVLAVYAYCEPVGVDSENLFKTAEIQNPTGDLILALHGSYRWKKDRASSEEIWRKLLMISGSQYFRNLAKDYIADVISESFNDAPFDLSPDTGFAEILIGATHTDHPQIREYYFLPTHSDNNLKVHSDLSYQHWTPTGAVGLHYELEYRQYLQQKNYNYWENLLEVPLTVHVAKAKDFILLPLIGYRTLDGIPLDLTYGFRLKAAVLRTEYVQSVQASIYAQTIYRNDINPDQGAHYRFQYNWDFFPIGWHISTEVAVEHVSCDDSTQYLGKFGVFELSHNDVGLNFKVQREFNKFTLGIDPILVARFDTYPSNYQNNSQTGNILKSRNDLESRTNLYVSIPIFNSVRLVAWSELIRLMSSFGNNDYVNRNFSNQKVGLALKTSLSTY